MFKSILNAFNGIFAALKSERNLRFHLFATIVVVALGAYFQVSEVDWLLLSLAIFGVWASELINTAIEKLVDIVQPEFDERVKFIKDVSAGAVLLISFAAIAVAIYVFGPIVSFIIAFT